MFDAILIYLVLCSIWTLIFMMAVWNSLQYAVLALASPLSNPTPFRLLAARVLRNAGFFVHSVVMAYLLHFTMWKGNSGPSVLWILILAGGLFFYLSIGKPLYEGHIGAHQNSALGAARVIRHDFAFFYSAIVLFVLISAIGIFQPGSDLDEMLDRIVRWLIDVPLLSGLIILIAIVYAASVIWQGMLMVLARIILPRSD